MKILTWVFGLYRLFPQQSAEVKPHGLGMILPEQQTYGCMKVYENTMLPEK